MWKPCSVNLIVPGLLNAEWQLYHILFFCLSSSYFSGQTAESKNHGVRGANSGDKEREEIGTGHSQPANKNITLILFLFLRDSNDVLRINNFVNS